MHAERVQVEGRAHGAKVEGRHLCIRQLAAQQVQQQRGDQRPVHDQAGVALDLGHVLAVVVDAVAVEGQRRIAEQRHRIRRDAARPGLLAGKRRRLRRGRRLARLRGAAIHDVMLLGQGQAARIQGLVLHQHEQQLARAAGLVLDRLDGRAALHLLAHAQRVGRLPGQAPTGPHAPGQRHGRQEAAALRMPVRPDLAGARMRQKVQPMPQRRHGGAQGGRRVVPVQRGRQGAQRRGTDQVVPEFTAPLPGLERGQRGGAQGRGRRRRVGHGACFGVLGRGRRRPTPRGLPAAAQGLG